MAATMRQMATQAEKLYYAAGAVKEALLAESQPLQDVAMPEQTEQTPSADLISQSNVSSPTVERINEDITSPEPVSTQPTAPVENRYPNITDALSGAGAAQKPLFTDSGTPDDETVHKGFDGFRQKENSSGSFEMELGVKWLGRFGIVALLIGVALALSYSFPQFPNPLKILTGLMSGAGLFYLGHWLLQRAPILGRVLQGGGLSVGYISLFATFFMPDVQLIDAPILGLVLLFAYVAGCMVLSHRLKSQTVALLSLAFGYYTAGYSETASLAYASTAILTLATVGIARLNDSWKVLPVANLLGAYGTYVYWFNHDDYRRGSVDFDPIANLYLLFTFGLFSLLRGKQGEALINALNCFVFYTLHATTQSAQMDKGGREFMLALVQGLTWVVTEQSERWRRSSLSSSLVCLTVLFVGLGTMRYFNADVLSAVLAAEALALGALSMQESYRRILVTGSYAFLALAFLSFLYPHGLSGWSLYWNMLWVASVAVCLENKPFIAHPAPVRAILISFAMFYLWIATLTGPPSEWRTILLMLTGFSLLALGFLNHRKPYRWLALWWIFLIGGGSLLGDLAVLETGYKILLFILVGVGLLGGSYGYTRLEQWMNAKSSEDDAEETP
jgi:hypothetical protein